MTCDHTRVSIIAFDWTALECEDCDHIIDLDPVAAHILRDAIIGSQQ
jgi:hypothetical protein